MSDEEQIPAITAEEVRRRAAVAGVAIDEELIDELVNAMDLALAPLQGLDLRAMRLVEPAVRFDAVSGFPDGEGW